MKEHNFEMTPTIAATEAIADAVTRTQARLLAPTVTLIKEEQLPSKLALSLLSKDLEETTLNKCGFESINLLYFLSQNNANLFKVMILLGATYDSWYSFRESWTHHTYALLQDKASVWHATSPANFFSERTLQEDPTQTNGFGNILSDTSLDSLVADIQATDGGRWPNGAYIEYTLDRELHRPVTDGDFFYLFRMRSERDFNTARYIKRRMTPEGIVDRSYETDDD